MALDNEDFEVMQNMYLQMKFENAFRLYEKKWITITQLIGYAKEAGFVTKLDGLLDEVEEEDLI